MAKCEWLSGMVAKEAHGQILNCLLDNHCYGQGWHRDRQRDPGHGWIIQFPWCWKPEEEVAICSAFLLWLKMADMDKYEKIIRVTKGNPNKCLVDELQHCVKETKSWYDEKHLCDASFYLVDDSKILESPTTSTSNTFDGWELGTKNYRWSACYSTVDRLTLIKIIIVMRKTAFRLSNNVFWVHLSALIELPMTR